MSEFRLAAAPNQVHVECEIAGTKGDTLDARLRRENGADPVKAARCLDDWDQVDTALRQAVLAFELRQQPVDRREARGALDFRQNDTVETGPHDRHEIAVAELGI